MNEFANLPLTALQAVEAVARTGSLVGAARELGVTVGAVSQRVAKAEAALGLALFVRESRGMRPTAQGEEMVAHLTPGFRQLARAIEAATRDRHHTLTVSVAPIFAARWLVWRLPRFTERHPDIRVRIDSATEMVDPNTTDVDLCLRVGKGGWTGMRVEKLFDQRITPVCSPDMAKRLSTPADLAHVPIITDVNAAFAWDDWLKPEGLDASILGGGPSFSDGSVALDAAMSGAGVFLAWETIDLHALKSGRIVAPFARREPTGQSYWLLSAEDRAPGRAQLYFTRWMKEELAADGIGVT